jgi:L,D-transpeptidase ErfK/SrfK
MLKSILKIQLVILTLIPLFSQAAIFPLPAEGNDMIGQVTEAQVGNYDNNFNILGRVYDLGYTQMVDANPSMRPQSPGVSRITTIPAEYLLPDGPREGIVVNISEMRLYYFPENTNEVVTFPVGIGIVGWDTPLVETKIVQKQENPIWTVPKTIQDNYILKGVKFDPIVGPGPKNPLGHFAMRLAVPGYLIHGTNAPTSIGTRASSGCIRLYPEDIKSLFSMVPRGTPVRIIDDPYKIGWNNGQLYLEAHAPLNPDAKQKFDFTQLTNSILAVIQNTNYAVDWKKTIDIAKQHSGIPQVISIAKDPADKTASQLPTPAVLDADA